MNKTWSKLTNFTCFFFLVTFLRVRLNPGLDEQAYLSFTPIASRNFTIEIKLFEAPESGIANLSFQQLLQCLINLSPCENKVFSLKFPSLTLMMIHMPFLYVQVCNHRVRLTVRRERLRNNFL